MCQTADIVETDENKMPKLHIQQQRRGPGHFDHGHNAILSGGVSRIQKSVERNAFLLGQSLLQKAEANGK